MASIKRSELLAAMDNQFRDADTIAHRCGHGEAIHRDQIVARLRNLVRGKAIISRDIGGRKFYRLPPNVKVREKPKLLDPHQFHSSQRKEPQ